MKTADIKEYHKQYWIKNKERLTPIRKDYFKEYWDINKEIVNSKRKEKYKIKKRMK